MQTGKLSIALPLPLTLPRYRSLHLSHSPALPFPLPLSLWWLFAPLWFSPETPFIATYCDDFILVWSTGLLSRVPDEANSFEFWAKEGFSDLQITKWCRGVSEIGIHENDCMGWLLRIMKTLHKGPRNLWNRLGWETKLFLPNGVLIDSVDSCLLRKMVMEVHTRTKASKGLDSLSRWTTRGSTYFRAFGYEPRKSSVNRARRVEKSVSTKGKDHHKWHWQARGSLRRKFPSQRVVLVVWNFSYFSWQGSA